MGSWISVYILAKALNPPGMLWVKGGEGGGVGRGEHHKPLANEVTSGTPNGPPGGSHLNVGELPVLGPHEFPKGGGVPGHLHGLPHQLRIMKHMSQLGVALEGDGARTEIHVYR